MKEQQERITGFFEKNRAKLTQYVHRRIRDASDMDAEDIVADVLLNMFIRADPNVQVENLAAYIYRSMANRIADYRRRKKLTVSLDQTNGEDETTFMDTLADPSAGVDQVMESRNLKEQLYKAIGMLEPRQRAVWVATEIEGRSFRELSMSWHEPMGTLLSRKSRAVKALQTILQETLRND